MTKTQWLASADVLLFERVTTTAACHRVLWNLHTLTKFHRAKAKKRSLIIGQIHPKCLPYVPRDQMNYTFYSVERNIFDMANNENKNNAMVWSTFVDGLSKIR